MCNPTNFKKLEVATLNAWLNSGFYNLIPRKNSKKKMENVKTFKLTIFVVYGKLIYYEFAKWSRRHINNVKVEVEVDLNYGLIIETTINRIIKVGYLLIIETCLSYGLIIIMKLNYWQL